MFGAILILFALPWLDRSPIKSFRSRPLFAIFTCFFMVVFVTLGYIGGQPPEEPYITIGQICTFLYFAHFLLILPILPKFEKTKPLAESIDADYTSGGHIL